MMREGYLKLNTRLIMIFFRFDRQQKMVESSIQMKEGDVTQMRSASVAPSKVSWAFLFYLLIKAQGVLSPDGFFPFFT